MKSIREQLEKARDEDKLVHPCEHWHFDCSFREGGPCFDEHVPPEDVDHSLEREGIERQEREAMKQLMREGEVTKVETLTREEKHAKAVRLRSKKHYRINPEVK